MLGAFKRSHNKWMDKSPRAALCTAPTQTDQQPKLQREEKTYLFVTFFPSSCGLTLWPLGNRVYHKFVWCHFPVVFSVVFKFTNLQMIATYKRTARLISTRSFHPDNQKGKTGLEDSLGWWLAGIILSVEKVYRFCLNIRHVRYFQLIQHELTISVRLDVLASVTSQESAGSSQLYS